MTAELNWDELESEIWKIFIIGRSSSAHREETCCLCARSEKSININIKIKEEKSTVLQVILLLFSFYTLIGKVNYAFSPLEGAMERTEGDEQGGGWSVGCGGGRVPPWPFQQRLV